MGASATRPSAERSDRLRVAVAVSGGRDSTALWHATARWARDQDAEVHALHVHHGLSPQADAWVKHLRRQASDWRRRGSPVQLHVTRLAGRPACGDSVEAWARRERYAALSHMAHACGCDLVLLAHHRRDQAETFLLQALRGGAPAGLAAMPALALRSGIRWARPWLDQPRAAIEAYLARHRLRWVDDDSNEHAQLARNRLRLDVWPALEAAFGQAEVALAAAAARAAEAAACLRDLAALDLADQGEPGDAIAVAVLGGLSPARRANALRHGLQRLIGRSAPQSLVERLLQELPGRSATRWPAPGGWLTWYGGLLRFEPDPASGAGGAPEPGSTGPGWLDLREPGVYELGPGLGRMTVTQSERGGVDVDSLFPVELRRRRGGERFQFEPSSLPRTLKKQFQARRVPAWARVDLLLFARGELLFVPGLGVDARRLADPGRPQRSLHWERSDA